MSGSDRLLEFDNRNRLNQTLADVIAAQLRAAVARNGKATLVVSGGSTPLPMFDVLSAQKLPWNKVTVLLADERQVAEDHHDSNSRQVLKHLLQAEAAAAQYISLWNHDWSAKANLEHMETVFNAIPENFDVVILGMGNDGHTASLFPCADATALKEAMDPANNASCALITPTTAPHKRLTLTLSRLVKANRLVLHITGSEKKQVLEKALDGTDSLTMPIRAFLMQPCNIDIFWAK